MTIEIPGYRIEGELGRGAMGTVYLALRESLQRQVALKVLDPSLIADSGFRERFLKEGRIVAQLNHIHIVTVHDIGSYGDSLYMDLELARRGSLVERIQTGLRPEMAVALAIDIAEALAYAHRRDFVHRDVKPANILFREDDTALLSDFGIAKSLGNETQLTAFGMSIGTPNYMSPEQGLGQPVTNRSDLYSLGVTFYEMLTGKRPYRADSAYAVVAMHMNAPPPRLPGELARFQPIIDRTMAKDPIQRFESGEALIEALYEVSGFEPPAASSGQRPAFETGRISLGAEPAANSAQPSALANAKTRVVSSSEPAANSARPPALASTRIVADTDRGHHRPGSRSNARESALPNASDTLPDGGEETLLLSPVRDTAPGRGQTLIRGAIGTLILLLAVAGVWLWSQAPPGPQAPTTGIPEATGVALTTPESLLARNFEALMAVAEVRRELAASDPKNPADRAAGADLAEKFAAIVERTLLAGDRPRARAMLEQALALVTDSSRLEALERTSGEAGPAVTAAQREQIDDLLGKASEHIRERQFTLPRDANAMDSYRQVLLMDARNATASAGLKAMADVLVRKAQDEMKAGDFTQAARSIEAGLMMRPDHPELRALSRHFVTD